MLSIETHSTFDRHYRKLPASVKTSAKERERLFRTDPYHPRLRTHKLHDKERGAWAFWINQKYRIIFVFLSETHILFLDIGTHDRYR